MENKTAGKAREIIKDVFNCKYKGGYGEKLLKFLERSGMTLIARIKESFHAKIDSL